MREILFRGKRQYTGEWAESVCPLGVMHSGHLCDDFIPATVGQYTGLTDKNGKRIFEGDIVEGGDFNEEDGYGTVEWHDGAFEINSLFTTATFHENYWGRELEVIGNIHDNPELLEVGE